MREDWQDQVKIINSIGPTGRTVITITAHDADKGFALKAACNHLSIAIDSIGAFRDAENDIMMFKRAGLSIAMGQADDNVKASASLVTGGRREDGGRRAGLICLRFDLYHSPTLSIDAHGSFAGRGSPACSSSIEMLSGDLTKAILPSCGGRLMVTPPSNRRWQTA